MIEVVDACAMVVERRWSAKLNLAIFLSIKKFSANFVSGSAPAFAPMATSLARQLQAIRSDTVATLDKRKHDKVASLFLDPDEAGKQSLDSAFSIGSNGLHGLIQLDQRFGKFEKTLFAVNSKEIDRTIQV